MNERYDNPKRRRGNTMVLVTGILVLLVIIAAAYVSRTQAGRVTSTAVQKSEQRDDIAGQTADLIALEIAADLFVEPVDLNDPDVVAGGVADANYPRRMSVWVPYRYGVDPFFPYNRAPYATVPYTNWPDPVSDADVRLFSLAPGLGNPYLNGGFAGIGNPAVGPLRFETNPLGNPGFGDSRWLRDTEPLRVRIDPDGIPGNGNEYERYTHWRHLTNLSRASNGWRVVGDIADVEGTLVFDLNIPVEQWLAAPPALAVAPGFADSIFGPAVLGYYQSWMASLDDYLNTYADYNVVGNAVTVNAPTNFIRVKNPDGDNALLEPGERPQDRFTPNTLRYDLERYLADPDGDGYTDALWHLVPVTAENGVRYIAAVSIVDNCAALNVNVATRFIRNDANFTIGARTKGHTPADLALVGQNAAFAFPDDTWNVGYFDAFANHESFMIFPPGYLAYGNDLVRWEPNRWIDVRREIGVLGNTDFPEQLTTAAERALYWRRAGRRPLDAAAGLTPFGLPEEIELRMYHGQNVPWIFSRLENTLQSSTQYAFLHASLDREESNEYLEQLNQYELLHDHRKRLTTYSGARNEMKPPYLWVFAPGVDLDGDGDVDGADRALFLAGAQKYDLRLPPGQIDIDVLKAAIRQAISYEQIIPAQQPVYQTYHGEGGQAAQQTEHLVASLAANILAYRDEDIFAPLNQAVPVDAGGIGLQDTRYLGMEPQPFLVEAFVGHVYKGYEVPPADFEADPWLNAGDFVVIDEPSLRGVVAAVQIANPFDVSLNLNGYELELFGRSVSLSGYTLPPATGEPFFNGTEWERSYPTIVVRAISSDIDGDAQTGDWIDFLDIVPTVAGIGDLPEGSDVIDASGSWELSDRAVYDTATEEAVVLKRGFVVIDRFDPPNEPILRDAVNEMGAAQNKPATLQGPPTDANSDPPLDWEFPPQNFIVDGSPISLGSGGDDYWVQWVRATRAWGYDVDQDGTIAGSDYLELYEDDERNPRYVFGDYTVITSEDDGDTGSGYKFTFGDPADTPWFSREYRDSRNALVTGRKPTFFDLNPIVAGTSRRVVFPDKGWYGQADADGDGLQGDDDPLFSPIDGTPTVRRRFPMQMLVKNADFEQVGELLDVFLYGHELRFNAAGIYQETITTFSEFMSETNEELVGNGARVNRLLMEPIDLDSPPDGDDAGALIGGFTTQEIFDALTGGPTAFADYLVDPRHAIPALPAGVRLLASFACDGAGQSAGVPDPPFLRNAADYDGVMTPGLINLNTAPVEVLRTFPHWHRLIHEESDSGVWDPLNNPFPRVAEAIVRYRDRIGDPLDLFVDPEAPYGHRGAFLNVPAIIPNLYYSFPSATGQHAAHVPGMRGERGFELPSELMLLTQGGKLGKEQDDPDVIGQPEHETLVYTTASVGLNASFNVFDNSTYSIEFPALPERTRLIADLNADFTISAVNDAANTSLFLIAPIVGDANFDQKDATLSTDVNRRYIGNVALPDTVALDAEEANLLYSGASNLVTTRSDVFTVYFKLRGFKATIDQATGLPVWDATNSEAIVDEVRYVMLVDRSEVDAPGERPRILYMEKLPN